MTVHQRESDLRLAVRHVLQDRRGDAAARWRHGYLTDRDLAQLAADPEMRLVPCLVRCGGCRFVAPAQDVARLVALIEASGDYVRDVSSTDVAHAFDA